MISDKIVPDEKADNMGQGNGDGRAYDPQEEYYFKLAVSEGEKFDSKLFWLNGGAFTLSVAFFQATDTLSPHFSLIIGYAALLLSLLILMVGIRISTSTNNGWAKHYRKLNNGEQIDAKDKNKVNLERKGVVIDRINDIALALTFIGIACIVLYVFMKL